MEEEGSLKLSEASIVFPSGSQGTAVLCLPHPKVSFDCSPGTPSTNLPQSATLLPTGEQGRVYLWRKCGFQKGSDI